MADPCRRRLAAAGADQRVFPALPSGPRRDVAVVVHAPGRRSARAVRAVAALGLATLAALPFLLHYSAVHEAQGLARGIGEMRAYSAYPGAFLSATPILRFWHTAEPRTTEQYLFPGATARRPVAVRTAASPAGIAAFSSTPARQLILAALSFGPAPDPGGARRLVASVLVARRGCRGLAGCASRRASTCWLSCASRWRRGSRTPTSGPGCPIAGLLLGVVLAGLAFDGVIAGMPLGFPPGDIALDGTQRPRAGAAVRRWTPDRLRDVPIDVASPAGGQRLRRLHPLGRRRHRVGRCAAATRRS